MLLDKAEPEALATLLGSIDPERYIEASGRIATCAADTWIFSRSDCESLVRRLSAVTSAAPPRIAPNLSPTPQNEGGLS